jgi:hypothetical protein
MLHKVSKFAKNLKETHNYVKKYGEDWIDYSPGRNFRSNLARNTPPWYKRIIWLRILIFPKWIMNRARISSNALPSSSDLYIFVSTLNQWNVLRETVSAVKLRGISCQVEFDFPIRSRMLEETNLNVRQSVFTLSNIVVGILVLFYRLLPLIKTLNKKDKRIVQYRLNSFFTIYFWVSYFLKLFDVSQPKLILISNDHSPANRALIIVAKHLDIKTSYVQHASVSERFHRLEFDYAFLDGEAALDKYRACEKNHSPGDDRLTGERHILLSGVKRPLPVQTLSKSEKLRVGLAFKDADGISPFFDVVEALIRAGHDVLIRYHPSTSKANVTMLYKRSEVFGKRVSINCPLNASVLDFFNSVSCLIASNTAMILEAELSKIKAIYFCFSPTADFDYYDFVKQGIASYAADTMELIEELKYPWVLTERKQLALANYSETFNTKWYGHEAELVAGYIEGIFRDEDITGFWGYRNFDQQ